ncbi:MbtH family NRPS accessory protein [Salinispora arenicola]|uniref:MbtH family NRPS accessory protein n=1 Tax=Salinispora arenicola TaxID=168697 RepID=UPI003F5CF484
MGETMIGNPFDPGDGTWLVVVNNAGQHALWRPFLDMPPGWRGRPALRRPRRGPRLRRA